MMPWIVVVPIVLVVGIVLGKMALQVDDWSRDLKENYAEMETVVLDEPAQSVRTRIVTWVDSMPNWQAQDSGDDSTKMHLVRRTRIMRYADDVHVTLESRDGQTTVEASSQSRLGKGDLGQNPRNLKTLRAMLID